MGLQIVDVVNHLDRDGQLRPPSGSPWPEFNPEEFDAHRFDWDELFGASDNEPRFRGAGPDFRDLVESQLGSGRRGTRSVDPAAEGFSPAVAPDVCAWYQPIHFHGLGWGIFIQEDCLLGLAVAIARHFHSPRRSPIREDIAALQMGFASLFLHEAYHHKAESFAIRLHVAEQKPAYQRYWSRVYEPAARPGGNGALEEAIANADSYRRLNERAYSRLAGKDWVAAARRCLANEFAVAPPGYRDAVHHLDDLGFTAGRGRHLSQVQEGAGVPHRSPEEWDLASNISKSLFNLRSEIWVVVSKGRTPRLPTLPLYRPVSSVDLEKALRRRYGYQRVKGGKGSHIRLAADGMKKLTLTDRREAVSPVVLRSISQAIGFRDTGDFLAELGL